MTTAVQRVICTLALALSLAACSQLEELPTELFGEQEAPLPGKRISVLALDAALEADPSVADLEVRLP